MSTGSRTRYAILGCLTLEPMSGYDVKQFLGRSVVHFWTESFGQIYPALRKLEEEGMVAGRDVPGERGGEKRVYRITDAGREELEEWLTEPAEPVKPRYEHSLKLFFGHNVGPRASLEHVRRLRRRASESLSAYREWEERLEEQENEDPASPAVYRLVVLRGGIRYAEMVLEWCDASEEALSALAEPGSPGDDQGAPAGE